jgi:uncharacterized membrane protein
VPDTPKPNPRQQQPPDNPAHLRMEISASRFVGPLPHPEILAGYEEACPGAALRIIQMAEDEGRSRRALEAKAVDAQVEGMRRQFWEARLGQIFAFSIAALFLGCGTYIATLGQPWAGALFGGIGLGGIVTTFIAGRTRVTQEPTGDDQSPKAHVPAKRKK